MIDVKHLSKSFGDHLVLDDFSEHVSPGENVCIIGPSGSGKSTFLRCLNLLEQPTAGTITFAGTEITDPKVNIDAMRRQMGMVFQHFNLFPHLTVKKNLELAPSLLKLKDKDAISARADELLARVGLADKANAYPKSLSGGQQQRVAIARALAPRPRLLLLDEPLSALDAWARASIGEQLRPIQEASGVTTVMVTHVRQEALSLSDYVVVMNAGHVEQADAPNEIYDRPASEFVATFVGGMNIVRMPLIREGAATGLRYADVKLHRATEAALARPYTFVGKVQAVQFMGDTVRVKVLMNDFQTTITADALRINTDRSVFALHSLIAVELPESAWRTWGAQ